MENWMKGYYCKTNFYGSLSFSFSFQRFIALVTKKNLYVSVEILFYFIFCMPLSLSLGCFTFLNEYISILIFTKDLLNLGA